MNKLFIDETLTYITILLTFLAIWLFNFKQREDRLLLSCEKYGYYKIEDRVALIKCNVILR